MYNFGCKAHIYLGIKYTWCFSIILLQFKARFIKFEKKVEQNQATFYNSPGRKYSVKKIGGK